jgi:hypothetical protein
MLPFFLRSFFRIDALDANPQVAESAKTRLTNLIFTILASLEFAFDECLDIHVRGGS